MKILQKILVGAFLIGAVGGLSACGGSDSPGVLANTNAFTDVCVITPGSCGQQP